MVECVRTLLIALSSGTLIGISPDTSGVCIRLRLSDGLNLTHRCGLPFRVLVYPPRIKSKAEI